MVFKKKKKVKVESKIEPVIIEKIEEKAPEPILCKAKGCSQYPHTQGFCRSCARDLKLL